MKLVNFYEVQSKNGDVQWGGASASEAYDWFRRSLNSSIFVSVWNEEDIEEPVLITEKIDVTRLVLAVLAWDRQDQMPPKPKKEWSYL